MANYIIGQRVRLVGEWKGPPGESAYGEEARVVGDGSFTGMFTLKAHRYLVETKVGRLIACGPDDMEPLTDPGHTAISIEALLSTPELQGFGLDRILEHVS